MYEVFLSGLKEWRKKLKEEIEELEDEREKTKKGNVFYTSLTGRIDMRYETIEEVDHQIKLKEKKIEILQGAK